MLVDQRLHLRLARHNRRYVLANGKAKVFQQLGVERIGESDMNAFGIEADRECPIQLCHAARHDSHQFRRRIKSTQIEVLRADLFGHDRPKFIFTAEDFKLRQHLEHVLAPMHRFLGNIIRLPIVDDASRHQHVHHVLRRHNVISSVALLP